MTEQEPAVGPVVKVARDLREIERLHEALESQAIHKANDRLMPGGLAMVALGGVANLEAWEHQYEAREALGRDTSHVLAEDDSWEPPLQTLLFWSEAWRAEHGAEYGQRPTVASEANFLRYMLEWAWDNEPRFYDFAKDVNRARVRLENVLYAGRRAERTRVPCTNEACDRRPRLIRIYAQLATADHYRCPACRTDYDSVTYARAKLRLLESEGADRYVKMQDARDAIGRSERTFRKWLRFWHVRSYYDASTGQTWVWWPDVRETDQVTQRRQRSA